MAFLSSTFLILAAIAVIIGNAKLPSGLRTLGLLVVSCCFAESFLTHSQAAWLLGFCVQGYALSWLCGKRRTPSFAVPASVCLMIGSFLFLRGYLGHLSAAGMVGVSYIFFRMIQTLLQISSGGIALPGLGRYLLYLLFFPSFASGPVEGYQQFSQSLDNGAKENRHRDLLAPLPRAVWGIFKVYCLAQWLNDASSVLQNADVGVNLRALLFAGSSVIYVLEIYAGFSGYMDIVISVGRMTGISVPENFNEPFQSENFLEFWKRWHISVSNWFRDQVFYPLLKFFISRFARQKRNQHRHWAALCLFVSFTLMGIWHGTGQKYVIYGILLGLGIAVPALTTFQLPLPRIGKRALTMGYFSACLLLLQHDPDSLVTASSVFHMGGFLLIALMMVLLWIPLLLAYDAAEWATRAVKRPGFWREHLLPVTLSKRSSFAMVGTVALACLAGYGTLLGADQWLSASAYRWMRFDETFTPSHYADNPFVTDQFLNYVFSPEVCAKYKKQILILGSSETNVFMEFNGSATSVLNRLLPKDVISFNLGIGAYWQDSQVVLQDMILKKMRPECHPVIIQSVSMANFAPNLTVWPNFFGQYQGDFRKTIVDYKDYQELVFHKSLHHLIGFAAFLKTPFRHTDWGVPTEPWWRQWWEFALQRKTAVDSNQIYYGAEKTGAKYPRAYYDNPQLDCEDDLWFVAAIDGRPTKVLDYLTETYRQAGIPFYPYLHPTLGGPPNPRHPEVLCHDNELFITLFERRYPQSLPMHVRDFTSDNYMDDNHMNETGTKRQAEIWYSFLTKKGEI